MNVSIDDIIKIREEVRAMQKPSRYEHTLGVAYTAACMAFLYGEDPLRAELTGILHDCAKCFSSEELICLCRESGVPLSDEELASPQVIHAKYGSYMAEHTFGITDREMLDAIAFHTTGRPDMGTLEKIIFTADFIEPLRDKASNLHAARQLAFANLDLCVYNILQGTVDYLTNKGADIVSDTRRARDWYAEAVRKA